MKIRVNKTGSSGNSYILSDNEGNCLIIEAGIQRANVSPFCPSKPDALVYTHKHLDHSGFVAEYERIGINCFLSTEFEQKETENFIISTFKVEHSCDNRGLIIRNKNEGKTMLFITDFCFIDFENMERIRREKIDLAMIEVNYNLNLMMKEFALCGIKRSEALEYIENWDSRLLPAHFKGSVYHASDTLAKRVCKEAVWVNNPQCPIIGIHGSARLQNDVISKLVFNSPLFSVARERVSYLF